MAPARLEHPVAHPFRVAPYTALSCPRIRRSGPHALAAATPYSRTSWPCVAAGARRCLPASHVRTATDASSPHAPAFTNAVHRSHEAQFGSSSAATPGTGKGSVGRTQVGA